MGAFNSTGDVLVVRAEPLGHYLRLWRNRYVAEHPPPDVDTQAFGGGSLSHFGAINWLAQETQINKTTVGKICNGRIAQVSLHKADKLLTVIGMSYLLFNEIPVVPNVNWSIHAWALTMASRLSPVDNPVENSPLPVENPVYS
jgi:hypothetical protein